VRVTKGEEQNQESVSCGKEFQADTYKVRQGLEKYCSCACFGKAHDRHVETICYACGKEMTVRRNFINRKNPYCSIKCAGMGRRTRVKRSCLVCGKVFEVDACVVKIGRGLYCSHSCRGRTQRKSKKVA